MAFTCCAALGVGACSGGDVPGAGEGLSTASDAATPQATEAASEERSVATATTTDGEAGVPLRAVRLSDSEDLPDVPLAQGRLLLVPDGEADALWSALTGGPEVPAVPGIARGPLALADLPASWRVVDLGDGRPVPAPRGPVWVCLADPDAPAADALDVVGCARAEDLASTPRVTWARAVGIDAG